MSYILGKGNWEGSKEVGKEFTFFPSEKKKKHPSILLESK